jgi:hypothetical protein
VSEIQDFCSILTAVRRRAADVGTSRHPVLERLVEAARVQFGAASQDGRDIVEILRRDGQLVMVRKQRYMFLPAVPQRELRLASLDVNLVASPPSMHLAIMQFMFDEAEKLCCLGMRFETPSGQGGGAHDFHHAQLLSALGRKVVLPNCPAWLPDSQPSFPLDASGPVELLICAIASNYGAKMIGELRKYAPCIWARSKAMKLGALLEPA